MLKRIIVSAGLVVASCAPAFAQRAEVSGFYGWVFSDGVSGDAVAAGDGNIYDRVDPKDSGSFGFSVGVFLNPHSEVGFMWQRQSSTLILGGTAERELGDLAISSYHGYYAYNFGEADSPVRPFLFGGIGATSFGDVDVTLAGVDRTIAGESQFSAIWGGGVKFFPSPHVGVRVAGSWTPTYIKSDAAGWWCDPFWGCYLVGDAQYANQLEFSGGVTVRF